MSASFDIKSSTGSYQVEIAPGLFARMLAGSKDSITLCDARFAPDFERAGCKFIPLPAEETAKSLDAIPAVIVALRKLGANRDTHLHAVGGGIVQDIAAFCAAIFMRGIRWSYAPTTLLGMADSCIGGKSSINVGEYKNIVGTFNPPERVLIDPALAATLSAEQMAAGLMEAAKICYCRGHEAWRRYLAAHPSVKMSTEALTQTVTESLTAKKWFIEIDEFDRKERLLLNFGHTFGHAIEGASHFRVAHGLAVGIGILCALALGRRRGLEYTAPMTGELEAHVRALLGAVPALAGHLKDIKAADVFDRFTADKKHAADAYRVVAVAGNGGVELLSLPKNEASKTLLTAALQEVLDSLRSTASRAA